MTGTPSQAAFLSKLNECKGILHKICNLYASSASDREDLFQEMVIQLWNGYPRFREEAKFSTWLYRIALNTAISDLRKQSRHVEISYPEFIPKEESDSDDNAEKEEKLRELYTAIGKLSEIDKAIVMLYLDGKNYEEMEEILGINQNNLRVKMNRIKDKLRQMTKTEVYGS
ncbi:MAG: sigma-70 family RNA polymerase sigma factor [Terrimonas sp.]|nr:sigma-70 family RNA polymerase sigma factor [Terrimonas sp.]